MRASRFNSGLAAAVSSGLVVFFSGASTLTYEIVWQREMFHLFGASAPATAAILTAIFLGIAFGSRLSHRILPSVKRPIIILALLEAAIGLWGIVVPFAMRLAEKCYVATAHTVGEESAVLLFARFIFAVVPLLPSTLCMGATIPIMVRAFGKGDSQAVAWIYGLNILGAVAGAATTGLIWIRILGQAESAWVAIALNACVVLLLVFQNRRVELLSPAVAVNHVHGPSTPKLASLSGIYFAAGFVALGLEVVWLRLLGIVNSNSTVTFSLTLAFYLAGMGIGSLLLYPLIRRYASALATLTIANGGVAIVSLTTFPVIFATPFFNRHGIQIPAAEGTLTLTGLYYTEATSVFLLLFFPAMFMGMVYPAVCDAVAGDTDGHQNWIGKAYFVGTLGSVVGILAISLMVIPLLGLHATFSALVLTSATLCLFSASLEHVGRATYFAWTLMGLCTVGAVYLAADARPVLRRTTAQKVGERWMEFSPNDNSNPSAEIVRFVAGSSGTVITKREIDSDDHMVYVDDQLVASTNLGAKVDALMLAHLPLLLHDNPQNELTVGFGTGGTSHAITTHGISAYCVEIEPEVPRSAYLLTEQNYGILENPLFTLILNDARDHLKITQRKYDVIATDVTNLQYKQNSSLYTVEYFELMKSRLRAGGVACAWIPMAAIANDELRILMRSFQHVFPHATLWFMNHTHTNFGILIATPKPLRIDYSRLEEGFANPSIAASLAEVGLTEPMQLVHCLHLDENGYRAFCGDVPMHTDNNPTLEFSSPLSFYQYNETFCENLSSELEHRPRDFRQYVVKGPEDAAAVWKQHKIASLAGCKVILSMYQFRTLWMRQQRELALGVLQQAMQMAEAGLDAWPEDSTREQFYINFFDSANARIRSNLR